MNRMTRTTLVALVTLTSVTAATGEPMSREDVLAAMQQVMGPLPDRSNLPPLDSRTTETVDGDGYGRRTITFANLYDERVTAYLYVPTDLKPGERRPIALVLQSTGEAGKVIVDGTGPKGPRLGFARELAQRGYVVIAPDYPSFGEQKDYDFKKSRYASGTMKAISDNMRCVDLAQSLPQAEPGKVAALGHSLGGHNALFTAAFDPRIKVAVTSCGWTPFHYYYGGKKLENWAQDRYMPRVRDVYQNNPDRMPFDFPQLIAGAICPRAVFSCSPIADENFDVAGVRHAEPHIRKAYDAAGAPQNYNVTYPDTGHEFPQADRQAAYEFIDARLGYAPPKRDRRRRHGRDARATA